MATKTQIYKNMGMHSDLTTVDPINYPVRQNSADQGVAIPRRRCNINVAEALRLVEEGNRIAATFVRRNS